MDYSLVVLLTLAPSMLIIWALFRSFAKTPPPFSAVVLLSGAIAFVVGAWFAPDTGSAVLSLVVAGVFLAFEALDLSA